MRIDEHLPSRPNGFGKGPHRRRSSDASRLVQLWECLEVERRKARRPSPQATGGARAWNDAGSAILTASMLPGCSVTRSIAIGSGSSGATEGADIALSWISVQIGQLESPGLLCGSRDPGAFECEASIVEAA